MHRIWINRRTQLETFPTEYPGFHYLVVIQDGDREVHSFFWDEAASSILEVIQDCGGTGALSAMSRRALNMALADFDPRRA